MKRNLAVCIMLMVLSAPVFAASIKQDGTKPVQTMTQAKKQIRTLINAWRGSNGKEPPVDLFLTEDGYERAKKESGYCRDPALTLRSNHIEGTSGPEGDPVVTVTSYWSYIVEEKADGKPEASSTRRIIAMVTDEVFTYDQNLNVVDYRYTDITEETRKRFQKNQAEHLKVFEDEAEVKQKRMGAGLILFLNYWQIADYDHLWPTLDQMIDMGILEEPQGMKTLQGLTKRAVRQGFVPEEHAENVKKVMEWTRP